MGSAALAGQGHKFHASPSSSQHPKRLLSASVKPAPCSSRVAVGGAQREILYTVCDAAGHDKPGHPECAARITAVLQALQAEGLTSHPGVRRLDVPLSAGPDGSAPPELQQALERVHPPQYLARLAQICSSLAAPTMLDDSSYIAPASYAACLQSAAAVIAALDGLMAASTTGSTARHRQVAAVCLVRPPGHHVRKAQPMGFGLLNFVSIAAAAALRRHGAKRVLILDFDVHHGNGTEEVFYSSTEVLYISTHQAGLWPRTGRLQDTGDADGTGATINLPLPGGSGHAAMELVLQQLVAPAALRFQPDLIFVSAGFDAHFQDPLAGLTFTSSTYHLLASRVAQLAAQLCNGRCLFILEGGYHLPSLGASVAETFRGLMGLPLSGQDAEAAARLLARQPEPLAKVQALLDQAKRQHSIP